MPGEISRSNPGPKGDTPLVPRYICILNPGSAWDENPEYCRFCSSPMADHAKEDRNDGR